MSTTSWQQPGGLDQLDTRALIARAAVTDVVVASGLFFDSGEFDELSRLYTEDATFEMIPPPEGFPDRITGADQIAGGLAMLWKINREQVGVFSRHATSNLLVTQLGPDEAEVYSIVTVTGVYTDGHYDLRRLGNYVDRLRREGLAWRIASRRLYLQAPPALRPAEESGVGLDSEPAA